MPKPIPSSGPDAAVALPRQRSSRLLQSPRQSRERDWKTLVQTLRLLNRLVVERGKHHLLDEADTLARQAVHLEEQLEHDYPVRWPQLHPRLLLEQAGLWAQDHDDDPLDCQACLLNGALPERVDVPPPRRV